MSNFKFKARHKASGIITDVTVVDDAYIVDPDFPAIPKPIFDMMFDVLDNKKPIPAKQ